MTTRSSSRTRRAWIVLLPGFVSFAALACELQSGTLPTPTPATDAGAAEDGSAPSADDGGAGGMEAAPPQPSVDHTRLGPACRRSGDCEAGLCYDFKEVDRELTEPRCVEGSFCELVVCPPDRYCGARESDPAQVVCEAPPGQ